MQQDPVFKWVEADHEIGFQGRAVAEFLLVGFEFAIVLVDNFGFALSEDLMAVCDAARCPSLK